MPGQRKAIVIHSPHSGRAPQLTQALGHLRQAGFEIARVLPITRLESLPPQGAIWRKQGIAMAIAAGGDGLVGSTVRHVLGTGPVLGILPLGTANDTARSLRIPQNLAEAVQVIATGVESEVDVGMVTSLDDADPSGHGKQRDYFLHTLTIGLNVEFARLATSASMRERFGPMTYPVAALEALRSHEPLEVDLHFEQLFVPATLHSAEEKSQTAEAEKPALPEDFHCQALQVAVVNAPVFGGPLQLAIPGATVTDRLLDIVIVHGIDWKEIGEALSHFFRPGEEATAAQEGQPSHHPAELTAIPGLHHLQAAGVAISTSADPADVTLDGEVRSRTPVRVCIAPERLRVMAPAEFSPSHEQHG